MSTIIKANKRLLLVRRLMVSFFHAMTLVEAGAFLRVEKIPSGIACFLHKHILQNAIEDEIR